MKSSKPRVKYVYGGLRVQFVGPPKHTFFINGDVKRQVFYKRTRGCIIGRTYLGFKDSMFVRPDECNQQLEVGQTLIDKWRAEHAAGTEQKLRASAYNRAIRMAKQASVSKRLENMVDSLRSLTEDMDIFTKARFVEYLTRAVHEKKTRRRKK